MEYIRKFRWANYQTLKCKEYLRNDFSHECAYCKLQEKEVGFIDANYFEVDHFRPQSENDPSFNPHLYSNLYYACEKCNNEKSDTWSDLLLDPCKDNIFRGECPPIIGGYDEDTLFKYIPLNDKGQYYIDTFKLNSRHQIRIRKRRVNKQNNIREIDALIEEILHKFNNKKELENLKHLAEQLDNLRLSKNDELSMLSKDENFEAVGNYLSCCNVKNTVVFEEYNMDIKIKIGEISYYCELIVDDSEDDSEEKNKFLDTEKLKTWFGKLRYQFGILYYYPKLKKLYFYPISKLIKKDEINEFGSKKLIKLTKERLIL